jgi:A/G-specific adenine glycosylase
MESAKQATTALLGWYDVNARVMPWRTPPADRAVGVRPDPYAVWLSEVMLQQTTVAAVTGYFLRFTTRWPDVQALAAAKDGDVMGEWAGLGYYARARNLLKCARMVVETHDGNFPDTHAELMTLPGIGPYTAAAIASIAFDRAEVVVDGNVERVMARLFDIHTPLPAAKPELTEKAASLTPDRRAGDYAQAVMDLGATICTVRNPACGLCPLCDICSARRAGTAPDLPKRMPKKPKPTRHGIVYLAQTSEGAWLMERRPDKGLLGGMLGWPTSDWNDSPQDRPPFAAKWQTLPAQVRHTFTHFHLILSIRTATIPTDYTPKNSFVQPKHAFRPSDLPTVMRKAYDLWRTPGSALGPPP